MIGMAKYMVRLMLNRMLNVIYKGKMPGNNWKNAGKQLEKCRETIGKMQGNNLERHQCLGADMI